MDGVFNTTNASAAGVGLQKALDGYAKWTSEVMLPGTCEGYDYFEGTDNTECFDTYNASSPIYTDTSVNNTIDRQWMWFLCNEPFGFWQDGAPAGTPTIVSRLVTKDYFERQCALYFPEVDGYSFGQAEGKTATDVNLYTDGWSVTNRTRLIWTNGEFDPWLHATMSSSFRPGGPLQSTAQQPLQVIPGGIHCSDLIYENAEANAGVLEVINNEVAIVKGWVEEFYTQKSRRTLRGRPFRG